MAGSARDNDQDHGQDRSRGCDQGVALARELDEFLNSSSPAAPAALAAPASPTPRRATAAQITLIDTLQGEIRELGGSPDPDTEFTMDDLTLAEASELIEELRLQKRELGWDRQTWGRRRGSTGRGPGYDRGRW